MAKEKNTKPASKKDAGKPNYRRYIRIFWFLVALPIVGIITIISAVVLFADLPDIEALQNPKSNLASVVYANDGSKEIGRFYAENRVNVRYKDIDKDLIDALIATEDARYLDHSGIDAKGLLRVLVKTVIGGNMSSGGGSTITQQLAKMQFHNVKDLSLWQRSYQKLKEWIIAVRLERLYTKEEIMTMYLNKFDFIHSAVGIKSAAKVYFNATPDSLKVEEAAMLVGMCQNPSLWNPVGRADTAKHRRNVVMSQMVKYGYITQKQYDSLKVLPLRINYHPEDHNEGLATYFREYLRENFLKKWCSEHLKPDGKPYDLYRDGLRIYTTIDPKMQKYAEEAVAQHMKELQATFFERCKNKKNAPFSWRVSKDEIAQIMNQGMKRSDRYKGMKKAGASDEEIEKVFNTKIPMTVFAWNGDRDTVFSPMDSIRYYKSFLQTGFMAMDPQTGYIRAWVGGIDFHHFKYDHVKESRRQVGSTFKPFVYALAIQEGWSPCDRIANVRTCIPTPSGVDWCPDNSDNKHNGEMMTMKRALALSMNYVTTQIMKQFGPEAVIQFVRRIGITSPLDPVPSLCLGSADISLYEMVGANSTFANKGTWIEPTFVTRIEDKNGKVLADFIPKREEAMSEDKAYLMANLLKGVVDHGTGVRLRYKFKLTNPIAGKTGTTQNNSDGWFIGLTPELTGGAWVGAEDRSVHFDQTSEGQGASMALPIWAIFMQKVYADKTLKVGKGDFEKPNKKIMMELDCKQADEDPPDIFDPNDDPFDDFDGGL
ncbi:MAG: penicillin-binding protein 1A [Bacteroidetes bacterium]|nr:MAG: penicillin-binding protein 1A [Bacteroidota bacterium]